MNPLLASHRIDIERSVRGPRNAPMRRIRYPVVGISPWLNLFALSVVTLLLI